MPSTETRTCNQCHKSFAITAEDFGFYAKMQVPPPTWCPECGFKQKMLWRNERSLYWGECGLCKAKSMSMYQAGATFPVYCHNCFIGDAWDPIQYGTPYDFTKPFFSQFGSLLKTTPRVAVLQYGTSVNCAFTNYTRNTKNVYLAYSVSTGENIAYSFAVDWSKDVLDSLMAKNSELLYQAFNSDHCYKCQFVASSRDCADSAYLFDCVNCQDCFMSANLRNKQYVFYGKQLTKEAYVAAQSGVDLGSAVKREELLGEFRKLAVHSIHKYADMVRATGCTGDYISNCKNVHDSFSVYDSESAAHVIRILKAKDVNRSFSCGEGSELVYEGIVGGRGSSRIAYFASADTLRESQYTDWCSNSVNLFACIGLRNKQYCILNKQYTKEEYEALVPRIKKHMDEMPYIDQKGREYKYGEFFPPELSPFAYNETIAQEYFPLTKEEALNQGFRWRDPDTKEYKVTKTPDSLPPHIKDVPDSILQEVIGCSHGGECSHQCTTAFKIIPEELSFYRRMNLPLPRLCSNCRHYERLKQRNPLKLWRRTCMCEKTTHQHGDTPCTEEFETSYAPERKEVVYCESCYNAEVV